MEICQRRYSLKLAGHSELKCYVKGTPGVRKLEFDLLYGIGTRSSLYVTMYARARSMERQNFDHQDCAGIYAV